MDRTKRLLVVHMKATLSPPYCRSFVDAAARQSLRASMDGENLLPNAAEVMEEMAEEAK